MREIFFQLNLSLTIGWLFFQFLPIKSINFRSQTDIARSLLLSSLFSVVFIALLPDTLFPDLLPKVFAEVSRDMETAATVTKTSSAPRLIENQESLISSKSTFDLLILWPRVFFLGFLLATFKALKNQLALGKLLKSSFTLHKIGNVRVSLSESISIPFSTLFFGKAFVVLPATLVPHQKEFGIALRHEIEHHRRGDTRWSLLLEWLICVFYLNPFAYLWRKSILQLQELACDESLIGQMGVSKHDYGSCLLKVAEMALGRGGMYAGTTCMIPDSKSKDHSFLIRRIKMFKHHEQASIKKWQGLTIGTLLSALIFGGVYMAHAAVRSNSGPNPGTPIFNQKIQSTTENILSSGLQKHQASAGFAIVADPMTGVILAAANINNGFDDSLSENWALSYPLQPASAIKPLLVGSAIQAQATSINEKHDCLKGSFVWGGETIRDYKAFDKLSSADTIAQSSNICSIKIGQKLGADKIEVGFKDLGFGQGGVTKDFPSARSGQIPAAHESNKNLYIANMALGFSKNTEFYVTPLEMVQAYSAIANGGRLMKPVDLSGQQSSEVLGNVFSNQTSQDLQKALREVVLSGTGRTIKNSSVALAGKTSTANISGDRRVTGFIGYAPAEKPKLVAYVVLFDLKEKKAGSTTAAPVFKDVIESALNLYNP